MFYTIQNKQLYLFISKNFSITRKPAFAHFGKHEKKPLDVIFCLYKMKQSHWLLCIARNCNWSKKITSLSNLTQMASRGIKTYSESTSEPRNLQIHNIQAETLGCCLKYCRSWKNTLGKHSVAVNTGGHLIRVLNERSVSDDGNLCPL